MPGDVEIGRIVIELVRGRTVTAEIEIHPHSQELTVRERWPNGVERGAETISLERAVGLLNEWRASVPRGDAAECMHGNTHDCAACVAGEDGSEDNDP